MGLVWVVVVEFGFFDVGVFMYVVVLCKEFDDLLFIRIGVGLVFMFGGLWLVSCVVEILGL